MNIKKQPIQVSGAEHYMQQFHRWSCSVAPILDKNKNVLGAIGVAGHYEQVHRHTLGMVAAMAQAIQDKLYIQEINEQLKQSNEQLTMIFSMVTDGMVHAVGGKIIQVNKQMCTLLGMKETEILGRRVEDIISTTPKITKLLQDTGTENESREIVLEGKGRICNCLFELRKQRKEENSEPVELMIFMQVEEIQMLAQAIHNYSGRRHNPFIAVDCRAISKELFESELFGYERGAFTGARAEGKRGLLELADKGTLFLDEIGNMPLDMQVKLLRMQQEGVITKIGGTEQIEIDIRIIAATNTDLQTAVEKGTFRKDLFYRLNVFHIMMPALRERKEDIPLLARHFLTQGGEKKCEMTIDREAMNVLISYDFSAIPTLEEIFKVAEATGVAVHLLHLMYMVGIKGIMETALAKIDAAIANGCDITADTGLYNAFPTCIGSAILDGDWTKKYGSKISLEGLVISSGIYAGELCSRERYEYLRSEFPNTLVTVFVMDEEEIPVALKKDYVFVSTNAADEPHYERVGHPETAGTFPRLIRKYVLDKKVLSLSEAVKKISLLPAQRLELKIKAV